jgi:hypothetical protein
MPFARDLLAASAAVSLVLAASVAKAEPWFGWGQNKAEDRYLSGDLDVEDLVTGTITARSRTETEPSRAGTWVSLGGYLSVFEDGTQDVGVLVIAGVAFDRIAKGRREGGDVTAIGDGSAKLQPIPSPAPSPAPPPPPPDPPREPERVVVTPAVARHAVTAAWRTAGLGVDDSRIDSMIARARSSAALPEARFRAMRVFLLDGAQPSIVPIDTSSYATTSPTLVLEGRLTWRLDRLLFADDEPSLERLRLERGDARSKVAGRVLDALFQWQRAWIAVHTVKPGSRESTDATMRLIEAESGLDVMTGGWFGAWAEGTREADAVEERRTPSAAGSP